MRNKNKRRGVCACCGGTCYVELHHEPPRSEGGTETIPLCMPCHIARHVQTNDYARWGQQGGKATAERHPHVWRRNLKQYRQELKV